MRPERVPSVVEGLRCNSCDELGETGGDATSVDIREDCNMEHSNRKCVAVIVALIAIVGILLWSVDLPRNVRFAAPHQGRLRALAGRISFNPDLPPRLVDGIVKAIIPELRAGCLSKPPCDGRKAVPDNTGQNGQPYCYWDGRDTYACAKITCEFVGGSNLCKGPYYTPCQVPYVPGTISCNYADKVSCE